MPRPCKRRRICAMPFCSHFAPVSAEENTAVIMSVDELEAIRLIDLNGLTQEECAAIMRVARTTVQAIYNNARRKIADCLVNGRELKITGGDYVLCEHSAECGAKACGKGHKCCCGKNRRE